MEVIQVEMLRTFSQNLKSEMQKHGSIFNSGLSLTIFNSFCSILQQNSSTKYKIIIHFPILEMIEIMQS